MLLPALLLVLTALEWPVRAVPHNIWHISIDESPAPPPDKGPPLSAHALRDKSKLRYEVVGIVGAYLFWILFSILLLALVGRRLRRRHLSGSTVEILSPRPKPMVMAQSPPGPKSNPTSPRSARFSSWIKPARSHKSQHSVVSVATTVDEKVVERDRARDMDEMAQLYAVVMQHDEEKAIHRSQSILSQQDLPSPTQIPPEFRHLAHASPPTASNPSFTTTAVDDDQRTTVGSRASTRKTKVSPLSFVSQGQQRTDSVQSNKSRPSRISIRGQAISSPINFSHPRSPSATEDIPLSPRLYAPGPPPPTPGQKGATVTADDFIRGPTSPPVPSMSPPPTPGRRSAAAQAREAERDRVQRAKTPATLSLRSQAATNSSQSLPFRQAFPDALKSAPPIQTTFLERNPHLFNGARTGVPQTPYSPYQPQTPITPITPRLATKQEVRKAMKRQHNGPLTPEDMVPSGKQMWDDPL